MEHVSHKSNILGKISKCILYDNDSTSIANVYLALRRYVNSPSREYNVYHNKEKHSQIHNNHGFGVMEVVPSFTIWSLTITYTPPLK